MVENTGCTEYLLTSNNTLIPSDSPIVSKLLPGYSIIGFKAVRDLFSSFKCRICTKTFNSSDEMKFHKIHAHREKPYQCSTCGKCFTQKAHLKTHVRIHTGEKPYECSICGKCFTQNGTLEAHKRIHSGEKPYQCSTCWKRFPRLSGLRYHERKDTHW